MDAPWSVSAEVVVVVVGGPDRPADVVLPQNAVVIAADGGAELAAELGLGVDLLVGDLDSVSADRVASSGRVERHPAAKDASDFELALNAALGLEPERIVVVGGAGGRLDHLLGGLLLLAAGDYAGVQVDARLGDAVVHVLRGERRLAGTVGELISLFAVHGPAAGVVSEGLVYPLRGEVLEPGSSRGLSNLFAAPEAWIRVERGVVVAVRVNCSAAGESWCR